MPNSISLPRGGRAPLLERVAGLVLTLPWILIMGLLFLETRSSALPENYSLYVLVAGAVFLALPHGALDHLVPARVGFSWGKTRTGMALFLAAYVALAAAYYALWSWRPLLAFIGFLAATILHWGHGDQRFLELFLGRRRGSIVETSITVALRGSLPILTPIIAFPETAQSLLNHMTRVLGLNVTPPDFAAPMVATVLTSVLVVLAFLYVLVAYRLAASLHAFAVEGLELALLVILFTTIPAYLAVGVYFAFWHALRHLARLALLRRCDRESLAAGHYCRPLLKLCLDLLPVTCAALTLLGLIYMLNAPRVTSLEGFVAIYLILISSLTKPHLAVVALMDARPNDFSALR